MKRKPRPDERPRRISSSHCRNSRNWSRSSNAATCRWRESLALFEQGVRLTRQLPRGNLAQAQQRVEILLKEGGERIAPSTQAADTGND